MEVLEKLVRLPGYVAYGYLLRDPIWDPFARRTAVRKNRCLACLQRNSFQVALRCSRVAA